MSLYSWSFRREERVGIEIHEYQDGGIQYEKLFLVLPMGHLFRRLRELIQLISIHGLADADIPTKPIPVSEYAIPHFYEFILIYRQGAAVAEGVD